MDNFVIGETVENYKLMPPVRAVVKNDTVMVRHIGNLLVRKIKVEVILGMETIELEWLVENVRRPSQILVQNAAITLLTNTKVVI